jgi:hypothetical protein
MSIQVLRMTEADIDGAIDTIQQAFADDPYNNWVYPDRSKVRTHALEHHESELRETTQPSVQSLDAVQSIIRITDRLRIGFPDQKPRLPHAPLPLGHQARPLPRRALHLEPLQNPRLRHVAPPFPTLRPANLVPLPLLLVALALPNTDEPLVRPRRVVHETLLDLEGAASRSTEGALDR